MNCFTTGEIYPVLRQIIIVVRVQIGWLILIEVTFSMLKVVVLGTNATPKLAATRSTIVFSSIPSKTTFG